MGRITQGVLAVVLVLLTGVGAMAAATAVPRDHPVVLTGQINDTYQLVVESGEIYEIGINDVGNDLVDSHINDKVRVKGTISTAEDGALVITVETFEVITDSTGNASRP